MRARSLIVLFAFALIFATACGDDPEGPCIDCCKTCGDFKDLTEKWHVLNNFELAHTYRYINRYDQLLDPNFIFVFDDGDVGGDIPEMWSRSEEMEANTRLFDDALDDPNYPRCKRIIFDLDNDPTWVEFVPVGFPDEVWYSTTVFYDFQFDLEPDLTLVPFLGSMAQFTVRNAGTEEAPHWQLVELADLGANNLKSAVTASAQTTLGNVKSIYD